MSRGLAVAVAMASLVPAVYLFAQVSPPALQDRRIAAPAAPAVQPATAAPDPDNTGKPEDPAGPQSREPGDLMNSGTSVYVDDSFASVDKLRTAIRSAGQGQSQLAIRQFQEITDNYGRKLVLLNDNSYVSITDYVRDRLLAMPAVKSGMYDQLFGSDARREIEAAVEERDLAGLMRACDRYYPSAAALKGFGQAAEWYFERGEFVAAAQTWRKLLNHPMAGERMPQFLFSAAVAESLAQNASGAQSLRARLEKNFPDAGGMVSGTQVKLLAKLDEILRLPVWEKSDATGGDDWPAFEGGPSRSRLLKTSASIGARLWGMSMAGSVGIASSNVVNGNQLILRSTTPVVTGSGEMLTSHPVMSNGMIFVHGGGQVIALSANAGARLWAYPAEAAVIDAQTQLYIRNYGVNPRITAHDSATVYGDQVFAVLPLGTVNQAANIRTVNNMPTMATRVVCLNRDDGTQLWTRSAAEVKLEKEGALSFVGSPMVTRQGVFVMARKTDNANFSQQYLVRLDRDTGEPTWSCYLCSTSNVYNAYSTAPVPIPTLVDDILYISTGQGADCAVDANIGRILWLRPSPAPQGALVRGRVVMPSQTMPKSWLFNAPLVIGDTLLTSDTGQFLRLYNRWNGRLIKSIPAVELLATQEAGVATIDVMAGAIGTKVILSIRNISVCYELNALLAGTLKPEWTATVAGAGTPGGRPFLSESGYYVPFSSKLVRVDIRSGKSEQWDWPKNEKGEEGKPGNLLVSSEQVIVVNDQEVAGYSRWETARDNRLARITDKPADPEAYLALAEISFRTNHFELARENTKKSVDMANGGAAPAGQTAAEFLRRLYQTNIAFAEQLVARKDAVFWDETRFYYQQSHASARQPQQQAQWRLRLAELARQEKKFEEAALLYSEVLTDPALRAAGYQDEELNQNAGSTAEMKVREMVKTNGVQVYRRIEDEALAMTQRAIAAKDAATLQKVVDGYPNSIAALTAAGTLGDLYQNSKNFEAARQVFWWLAPRLDDKPNEQARVYASLATACLALNRFESATTWASRGMSRFKDFTWTENGKKISFADLKEQIAAMGGADIEGRLPILHATTGAPEMESPPGGPASRKEKDLISFLQPVGNNLQLLVPVETKASARQSSLLFTRSANEVSILDASKSMAVVGKVRLPQNLDTVLLGATKEAAVLMQRDAIIGVDLKTFATWTVPLKTVAAPPAVSGRVLTIGGRRVVVPQGASVQLVNNMVIVNGTPYGNLDTLTLVDESGNIYNPSSPSDPETIRRAAFSVLGQQARFTSARILNGKVYLLAGNEINAYDIQTGKPAWAGSGGMPIAAQLPPGANCIVGNETMIVAQVDTPGAKSCAFYAFDAETGKPRKTIKLETERAQWRFLGDDGMLFVATDAATAGYDMISEANHAVWRRTDIGVRFSGATAWTLDGLITVNDEHDVQCLSLESGETKWKAGLRLELLANSLNSNLRSSVQGDVIVFQSSDGSAAYKTQVQADADHQVAWIAAKITEPLARHSMNVSDTLAIELLQGALPNKAVAGGTSIVLRDRKGGRIYTNQPVTARGGVVRGWQVIDGAIALEFLPGDAPPGAGNGALGTIYLWKAVSPASTPAR